MTLAHTFPDVYNFEIAVADLSISGKKYMVVKDTETFVPDTISFYNLDFSFWKNIPCPSISGYYIVSSLYANLDVVGVSYASETLFNTDDLLEVAVLYASAGGGLGNCKLMIVNENGHFVDSIVNYRPGGDWFRVHKIDATTFVATAPTATGLKVYNLPGTLPCDACGGALGISKTENKPQDILSAPIPNPSKVQVKITFTLPYGVTRGQLQLFSNNGTQIKTWEVDNRFGYIVLDNSALQSGLYYYNIVVNGMVSSTQKMLVVK